MILLNNGKILNPLELEGENGQDIYYTYTHHYNSRSYAERFIRAKFIRYIRGNKKAVIQREDVTNQSKVPIGQLYKIEKQGG